MKRTKLYLWLLPLIAALATACSTDGKYVQQRNTICYSYWTFSFGTRYDTLPEVDAATFKSLQNWLGHDNRHAYFKAS